MRKVTRLAVFLLIWPALGLTGNQEPINVIRGATETVLRELNLAPDIRTDRAKLHRLIEQHILPHFDFMALSRLTLGKHWRKATREQRAKFASEFQTLLVRTYSMSLTEYKDQNIEYIAATTSPDNKRAAVRTRIVGDGRSPIGVDYRLRQVKKVWKIYDVSIDGVSLLANYRTTFAQKIRGAGLEGLIQHLEARNASVNSVSAAHL